ncbi:MAG: hypothetical protein P1U87_10700 [Verrucomicrobiales bacterium]|nr:hypothetical protein [Verrucomicrobiales bacterium]
MKNPYQDSPVIDTFEVSHGVALTGILTFLLFLVLIPLTGVKELAVRDSPDTQSLREQLRALETQFSEMSIFSRGREKDQALLVRWFREGNQQVLIGKEGWLYYRPGVETVVGKGSRYIEPPSVARAPGRKPWQSPLPVIQDFAEQLEARGVRLVLVLVPTKAMIYPEGLAAKRKGALPFEYDRTFQELQSMGIECVDLRSLEGQWMKQDTHWTPGAMKEAARRVAEVISAPGGPGKFAFSLVGEERIAKGDLVGMLGESNLEKQFGPERVLLERVVSAGDGEMLSQKSDSDVVLLGDSFVNIFDDVSLGFGEKGEKRIGAGFASHLAFATKQKLTVLASNGGGATTVRKRFAEERSKRTTAPKTVVWVLSARDLFLPELPARRAGIEWEFVKLPEATRSIEPKRESGELILTATLQEKSRIGEGAERKSAAYDSAIYSAIFSEISVERGSYEREEAWVFLWAAKKRKLMETASLKAGHRYRLRLIRFPEEGAESTATQLDDFFRLDLNRYFALEAEPME